MLLYHGVFAPHAARRRAAVTRAREDTVTPGERPKFQQENPLPVFPAAS